ncbi:unnamed protein product [Chondrus crispus]|uniref:Major facilitator superfamily (MFS) profile domain-containing protein n=1 Tax=Chondrus crispus TaxID=2769 RepID=R7QRJ0_CHOCR|nr:unnamed protein product [Chondrus crispus]CDF41107.1 unnamed protein product [Chondrus crispus]|eukprot:XP_005711401.1 unnamed protein product [Chondrus crispus]
MYCTLGYSIPYYAAIEARLLYRNLPYCECVGVITVLSHFHSQSAIRLLHELCSQLCGTMHASRFVRAKPQELRRKMLSASSTSAGSTSAGSTSSVAPQKLGRVVLACTSANIGGLLAGLQLALFSGILEMGSFRDAMSPQPVNSRAKSIITAALIAGNIIGTLPAGPLSDRAGRRPALLVCAGLFTLGALIMANAKALFQISIGRLIAGIAQSIANVVGPMYSAELAPPHLRGMIVNIFQLSITIGIFLAQLINWTVWADDAWTRPLMFAISSAVVMFCAVLAFVPESPSWLAAKGRRVEALSASRWLDAVPPEADTAETAETGGIGGLETHSGRTSLMKLLRDASSRRRLLIGAVLSAAQQMTGINAVIFFGPALVADVLKLSGSAAPFKAAAIVGFGNFLATVLSMGVIERFGRRQLLLATGPPMIFSLVTIGMMRDGFIGRSGAVGVCALLVFICGFALAYGPLTFVVQSEIFPVSYKGTAMSFCTMVLSFCALGVATGFLPLLERFGGGIYYFHAVCIVASSIFIAAFVPETRSLSLSEIDRMLG